MFVSGSGWAVRASGVSGSVEMRVYSTTLEGMTGGVKSARERVDG